MYHQQICQNTEESRWLSNAKKNGTTVIETTNRGRRQELGL
jgi:hypothetical protein